jgi:spore germination protein (amino acid permease)
MLVLLVAPLAFLDTPKIISIYLLNNAWMAAFGTIIPGLLLAAMFLYIINKSSSPFPLLLEEHLGIIMGKFIGITYIFFFLLVSSYSLRLFVDFIISNVLPGTPISVLLGALLITGIYAIKKGLENIARVCEIIIFIGLPFSLLITFLALGQNHDIERLLPFADMTYGSFGMGLSYAFLSLTKLMPVLTLAFFSSNKKHLGLTIYLVVITYVLIIGLATLATTLTLEGLPTSYSTFPTFSMVRALQFGGWVQSIDIFFIGIWIMGVFAAVTIAWFMACFTTQQVFVLREYRFLAAPSTLIIGISSLVLSRNILEVQIMGGMIIPIIYYIFLILIPLIIFIITLFKPYPKEQNISKPLSTTV